MKPEQERVHSLLKDTVSLLCKNGLSYTQHLKIEGVLGITVDNDVFIVHLDDKYEEEREKVPVVHPDSSAKDIAVGDEDEFHVKSEPGFIDDDDLIIMESDIKEEPVSHSASRKRPHPRSSEGPQRKVHNLSHRLTQSADVPSRPGSSGEAPYITGVMKDIDSVGDASSYGVPGFDSGGGLEGPSQQQNSPFPHDTINPASGSWPPVLESWDLMGNKTGGPFPWNRQRAYSEESLQEACAAVREGRLSAMRASIQYRVPRSTIRLRLKRQAEKDISADLNCLSGSLSVASASDVTAETHGTSVETNISKDELPFESG